MNKTLFELVPVSVKPEEDGWYFVIEPNHETGKNYCEWDSLNNGWYDEAANRREPTYYLLPLPPPVAEERTFTLADMLECWDAGVRRQMAYDAYVERGYEMDSPSIEEYFKAKFNITLPE